jgi:hypothetical protein
MARKNLQKNFLGLRYPSLAGENAPGTGSSLYEMAAIRALSHREAWCR